MVVLLRLIGVFIGTVIISIITSHFCLESELLQRFVAEKVESETIGGCENWWQGEPREACRKRKKEPHQNDARGSGGAFEYEDTFSARNSERRLLF